MKKESNGNKLLLNKETIAHLTEVEMEDVYGGIITSMAFSCPWYYTVCLLAACTHDPPPDN